MALSESIPYVFDNTAQQWGALWGSTLQYVLSRGNHDTSGQYNGISVLDQCCCIKPGAYAPMLTQCLAKETSTFTLTLAELFKPYSSNCGYFLCNNGWQSVEQNNVNGNINDAVSYEVASGATRYYPVAFNMLPQARVAVGNFDLSHYILVPTLTARQHNGTGQISADVKTYRLQYAASHPDITGITYRIYYKQDLSSTANATATSISIWGTAQYNRSLPWQRYIVQSYNHYINKYTSTRLRSIGTLYYPPQIAVEKISLPGTAQQIPSLKSTIGLSSTHGPDIQKLGFGDEPNFNNPYVYITFATALQIIDSVGFWWAESINDTKDAHGSITTSGNVHMPIIDSSGVPSGSITGGDVTNIEDSPIFQNWDPQNQEFPVGGSDVLGAVTVNPNQPTPPDTSEIQISIKLENEDQDVMPAVPQLNGLGVFSNYYVLAKNGIDQLNDFLWNSDESVIDDILNSLKLFGQSPIDAIISLRLYPFNFAQLLPAGTLAEEIVLGRVGTGVTALKIPSDASTTLDLGAIYLPRKYGNFLDYAPYSSYSLYIPFCGVITLNPQIFLDHYVSVKMIVDITTGKCTAIVYVGSDDSYGVPVQYVDGMIGVEIPVTAENMGKLGAAVLEAVGNTAAAAVSTGIAGAAFAAVGGAIDVMFTDIAPQKTGNISASGSLAMPLKMYAVVSSPTAEIPADYGHSKGYACDISTSLSAQSGYTVCYNVDTSSISGATDAERTEIKTLLEGGIFI